MATSPSPQFTDFSLDVLGRYVCNGLDEALHSADKTALRSDGTIQADARPFDVIVIGGGSFGPAVAQHILNTDKAHSHRILVLEAGRLSLPEHLQNLPMIPEPPVWGLPWRSPINFPGLAYTLGGRSLFFGGWSPQLLDQEMPRDRWPSNVVDALNNQYFGQASEQIGTNLTNDFIFGSLHEALRQRLFDGINGNQVQDAVPLAALPLHLDNVSPDQKHLFKLEAPLAVQSSPVRSGFFPFNKFSTLPLLTAAARTAQNESAGDDVKKRLMIVPDCHVTRLVTTVSGGMTQVVEVLTSRGSVPVPANALVIVALGTIESTRLAQISFPLLPNADLMGQNLMAHLRSNLTIRIPRAALPPTVPPELQASALFMKGRHTIDGKDSYFHLQITAAGLNKPSNDSEAELFKKVPDFDTLDAFRTITDDKVVITLRGIGEMSPQNPQNHVNLGAELDEYGLPRAQVQIGLSNRDNILWNAMDDSANEVAKVFANGQEFEVLNGRGVYVKVNASTNLVDIIPYTNRNDAINPGRRDGLGTTHHEGGTLQMGDDPNTSVTNGDGRFHHVANAYVVGPAVFPTIGSPNPMLTGVALARRLAEHLAQRPAPQADAGFQLLFDGVNTDQWRMSTVQNQPGRDNPGRFIVVDGTLESLPGNELGLFWHTIPTPMNFILKLEWLRWREEDNSGVFLRFPHPDSKAYNNTAYVGVHFGFEVQIDQLASPDGLGIHKTGAIYDLASPTNPNVLPVKPPGEWNQYEIQVQDQTYTVRLNGQEITNFMFVIGSDVLHPDRAFTDRDTFIGLQSHPGASRVAFRNIQIKPL
jgi:choline dehydrogenase-like flavoprotein